MKVLFVNTGLYFGGIASSMNNLIEEMLKNNMQVDLVLLHGKVDERFLLNPNVNLITIKNKLLESYFITLKDALKTKKFSNIPYIIFLRLYTRLFGEEKTAEHIVSKLDHIKGYDIGISYRNDEFQHDKPKLALCEDFVLNNVEANSKYAWIHNEPIRHGITNDIAMKRYINFDKIINVSNGCKKQFDQIAPSLSNKSYVFHNIIDIDEIKNNIKGESPYDNHEFHIITVARLHNEQKRLDRVIDISNKLRRDGFDFQWHILGQGEDELEIRKLINEYDLNDQVVLEGTKTNPFIYMHNADIFVLTSDYESFGMTIKESLYSGTPVITTNHIAASEVVNDGQNGFITDINSDALYTKVRYLLENKNIIKEMKDNLKTNDKVDLSLFS